MKKALLFVIVCLAASLAANWFLGSWVSLLKSERKELSSSYNHIQGIADKTAIRSEVLEIAFKDFLIKHARDKSVRDDAEKILANAYRVVYRKPGDKGDADGFAKKFMEF